jgi:hypothetical protein
MSLGASGSPKRERRQLASHHTSLCLQHIHFPINNEYALDMEIMHRLCLYGLVATVMGYPLKRKY